MNKKYKTQAIVLLLIGLLLSPSIYLLFYGADPSDESGLQKTVYYFIYSLPAFISVMCIIFGFGRLHAAISHDSLSNLVNTQRQVKRDLMALFIATTLLAIVGACMLFYVIHMLLLPNGLLPLLLTGAIPLCILIFSLVMVPLNIIKIMKQKQELSNLKKL